MELEQVKLKSGLKTLAINSPGSTSASVQIWFRAGSALEEKNEQGIAHFLEHMFFKGTSTRPGTALAYEVESFGGEINAFTSFDYTCYYINCPNSHLKQSIDILMDMVSNPLFTESDLIPERDVVFEEFRRSIDNPSQFSFNRLQDQFFPKGYSHSILGTEKTIKHFSKEQLTNFRNRYYHLGNAMLLIAGDLKTIPSLDEIVNHSIPSGGIKSEFPFFKLKKNIPVEVHQKDVPMSQISITLTAPQYESPQAPVEDLLMNCIGHGETSRLHRQLVQDTSLANKASASTLYLTKGGAHFIRLNFPHKNLSKVLNNLFTILKEIKQDGFEPWEIQKIKNQYIASKIYEKETLESYALALGHSFAQNGNIFCEDEFIAQMKKVSRGQINTAASDLFSRNASISLQIPQEESEEKSRQTIINFQNKIEKLFQTQMKGHGYNIQKSAYDPQAQVIELKKGIKLLYRQNKMTPTFVFHAYLQGGLSEEKAQNNGLYHLLSSLLCNGYENIDTEKINKIMDDCSATFNNFSGKNAYGLTLHGQSEHIFSIFPHFLGCLLNPKMPQKFLTHEKEMGFRALDNQEKDPVKKCFAEFNRLIFNGHPYAMNLIGSKPSLKRISRKSLLEQHQQNLNKKAILFTYCGDMDLNDVIELLSPAIKALPARNYKKIVAKKISPQNGKELHLKFDREQTQIFIGTPAPKLSSNQNHFFKMISTHLSGQSSELFVEVRDRQGLCYATQPLLFTAIEGGYWGIYMASGHDKVKAAIEAIHKIIDDIKNKGLNKVEFERIKKMIKGQNLLNVQSNEDYANIYSVPILQGLGIDLFYQNNEFINNLSYEEFQENIQKLFSKKWTQVTVGR